MEETAMYTHRREKIIKILGLITIFVGLLKVNSIAREYPSNWQDKPVVVNIQVNLESKNDKDYVDKILKEIKKHKGWATVFVTGEFASLYPEVVKQIEAEGHQIAVYGWQKGENLLNLGGEEQLRLIQKTFLVVRNIEKWGQKMGSTLILNI